MPVIRMVRQAQQEMARRMPAQPSSIRARRPKRSTNARATSVKTRLMAPVITMLNMMPLTPIAGAAINLFGVIEDHVDAAPLLQHGEAHADAQTWRTRRSRTVRASGPVAAFAAAASMSCISFVGIGRRPPMRARMARA